MFAAGEFKCKTGGVQCIPQTWKCDGEVDCRDRSDEENCEDNKCPEVQFSCGLPTNRCIYKTWVCDGEKDCPNGSDEQNCTTPSPPPAVSTNIPLFDQGVCMSGYKYCVNI